MDSNLVAIVVLNWNQAELTVECLESLYRQEGASFEIIVVDNGSKDGSPEILRGRFPGITLIENGKNLGFAGGMNVGIRHALSLGAASIYLLNNDTICDPLMMRNLLAHMDEGYAILSPAIYYASAPEILCAIGGKINPLLLEVGSIGKAGLVIEPEVMAMDFIPAFAWLVRREVFEKVGLLDEVSFFPIYYEDLDFCMRARRSGFRLAFVRDAKLWHKVSQASGGAHSPRERYLMARNSAYYFRKNMRLWQAPMIVLWRFGSALLWSVRLLARNNRAALASYWKGLLEGWFRPLPKKSPGQ